MQFKAPATAGTSEATLNIDLLFDDGNPGKPVPVQHHVKLKGTSLGPPPPPPPPASPGFSPSGFATLTTFIAATTASQTLCPTIKNTGTIALSLSSAPLPAVGSPEYFEIGNNANCPPTPPIYPACGSTLAADATCALAVTFNPAKFADAGGITPRTATLRVAHNAPNGPYTDFSMSGTVTPPTTPPGTPSIGLSTNPAKDLNGRVLPTPFQTQTVGTPSTAWNEFLVFNNGTADGLDLLDTNPVTQTNTSEFNLTEDCAKAPPLVRATGTNPHCTISLIFTPGGTGQRCTTLIVHATGIADSEPVTICGNGVAAPAAPTKAIITSPLPPAPDNSVVLENTLRFSGMESTPKLGIKYQWKVQVIDPAGAEKMEGTDAIQDVKFTIVGTYRITLTVTPIAGGDAKFDTLDIKVIAPSTTPAPFYSPAGFAALAGFSTSTAGSQTFCPTIKNTGTATLSLSFSAVQAAGSSTNFANYFELGDSASCPATPRACITSVPAGSPISGSTDLPTPADSTCTLALRFNPAKFGDAGGLGARSATLRVMHNAPAGSVAEYGLTGIVTARLLPSIGISSNPSAVNGRVLPPAFASQPINTPSTTWSELKVFNIGDADGLDLTEVKNSNDQEFTLAENCVIAPPLARSSTGTEANCVIALRFTPNALGERCTTITIRAAESSNGVQAPKICGTGIPVPGPAVTLAPESIDFGRRFINAGYPPKPLVISNGAGATASLQINAITLVGAGFALVPDVGSSQPPCVGTSLAAGTSCTVQVQFVPDPTRPETKYSASLQIDTNDAPTPRRTVSLAGMAGPVATPPVLQFPNTAAQIEFASLVVAGQQSVSPLTVTLYNAGPGRAAFESIRMVGADASSFSANSTDCKGSLEHQASCVISLRFVPGSGGLKRAQLEIVAASSISPPLVTVIGRGAGGSSAFLTASVANLTLGSVRVGAQSVPIEVRLASAGDGVVQVTGLQAGGPFTVQSKTCPAVPFTLPRGADCTVTVTFTPTDARAVTAMLLVSTDADTKAVQVPLTGSGEASANLSSGGCSMVSGDTLADPTLPALVLLAIGALLYRRRVRAAHRDRP